jgi:hypothetical protein
MEISQKSTWSGVSWLFNGAVIGKNVVYEGVLVPGELKEHLRIFNTNP